MFGDLRRNLINMERNIYKLHVEIFKPQSGTNSLGHFRSTLDTLTMHGFHHALRIRVDSSASMLTTRSQVLQLSISPNLWIPSILTNLRAVLQRIKSTTASFAHSSNSLQTTRDQETRLVRTAGDPDGWSPVRLWQQLLACSKFD